jgi:hypothetical protein
VYLRRRLETLERVTITTRGIARSLNDSAGLSNEVNPVRDPHAAVPVAEVLRELAAALRAYGRLARSKQIDRDALKTDVDQHLAGADEHQREVKDVMGADLAAPSVGWPLRGELVTHLERLRSELYPAPPHQDKRTGLPARTGRGPWRDRIGAAVDRWRRRREGG